MKFNPEETVSLIDVIVKAGFYMEKNKTGFYLKPYIKVDCRLIKDLYMKGKTLKLIESNVRKIFVIKSWERLFKTPTVSKMHKNT